MSSAPLPSVKINWRETEEQLREETFLLAEFFIDALGSLHIGSCSDIIVNHASKIKLPWTKTDSQKAYEKFRYPTSQSTSSLHNGVYYFKNRFKCMSSH